MSRAGMLERELLPAVEYHMARLQAQQTGPANPEPKRAPRLTRGAVTATAASRGAQPMQRAMTGAPTGGPRRKPFLPGGSSGARVAMPCAAGAAGVAGGACSGAAGALKANACLPLPDTVRTRYVTMHAPHSVIWQAACKMPAAEEGTFSVEQL